MRKCGFFGVIAAFLVLCSCASQQPLPEMLKPFPVEGVWIHNTNVSPSLNFYFSDDARFFAFQMAEDTFLIFSGNYSCVNNTILLNYPEMQGGVWLDEEQDTKWEFVLFSGDSLYIVTEERNALYLHRDKSGLNFITTKKIPESELFGMTIAGAGEFFATDLKEIQNGLYTIPNYYPGYAESVQLTTNQNGKIIACCYVYSGGKKNIERLEMETAALYGPGENKDGVLYFNENLPPNISQIYIAMNEQRAPAVFYISKNDTEQP
ncbi:hypothetical protein AGMMS49928_06980 [Spirochaetia bacterium]|nr:hypothetical protein AGMMS49928_06980 [Spirochaetia bacterium]